jgi:hypothetical protein
MRCSACQKPEFRISSDEADGQGGNEGSMTLFTIHALRESYSVVFDVYIYLCLHYLPYSVPSGRAPSSLYRASGSLVHLAQFIYNYSDSPYTVSTRPYNLVDELAGLTFQCSSSSSRGWVGPSGTLGRWCGCLMCVRRGVRKLLILTLT